jgi:hypothetical protein
VSATAAVFDTDSENSRIAFATPWTTAGPRGDDLGRFSGRNDGGGDEDMARFRRGGCDETASAVVTCVEREAIKYAGEQQWYWLT